MFWPPKWTNNVLLMWTLSKYRNVMWLDFRTSQWSCGVSCQRVRLSSCLTLRSWALWRQAPFRTNRSGACTDMSRLSLSSQLCKQPILLSRLLPLINYHLKYSRASFKLHDLCLPYSRVPEFHLTVKFLRMPLKNLAVIDNLVVVGNIFARVISL